MFLTYNKIMAINDQIRDEKLQYDINREAAKISALSSGKIHKYEYLTGEEILPSDQQQMIEQAKFTYFPLGKDFEKQIKTIEDQGKKQVQGLKTKAVSDKSDNNSSISKEIYDKILEGRINEILEMSRKINYSNLVYNFKGQNSSISFAEFEGPMYTYDQLKKGDKTLQQVEKEQEDFLKSLGEITSGNPKHKNESQLCTIKNVKNLYDSKQKIIDLLNDNSKIRSEAIYKSKQDETKVTGLKILTSKQMIQRLPIALAQVKAGNNSESLLNEIRQIVYSLYQSKQIT